MTPPNDRDFPPPVEKACNECPWRLASESGHLGPHSATAWIEIAHGESVIACHKTIVTAPGETTGDWDHPKIRQCRGAAQFRANVAKQPRNPTLVTGPISDAIFCTDAEFIAHHDPDAKFVCGHCKQPVAFVPGDRNRRTYWRHVRNGVGRALKCHGLKHQGNRRRVFVAAEGDWRLAL